MSEQQTYLVQLVTTYSVQATDHDNAVARVREWNTAKMEENYGYKNKCKVQATVESCRYHAHLKEEL